MYTTRRILTSEQIMTLSYAQNMMLIYLTQKSFTYPLYVNNL